MNALIVRIQVLAKSLLAKLTALLAILVVASQQLPTFPDAPAWIQRDLVSAIAMLTVAIAQVRKHTPVDDSQVGLLPPKGPGTPTIDATGAVHVPDTGSTTVHVILAVIAIVCGALILFVGIGAITMNGTAPWTVVGIGLIAAGLALVV